MKRVSLLFLLITFIIPNNVFAERAVSCNENVIYFLDNILNLPIYNIITIILYFIFIITFIYWLIINNSRFFGKIYNICKYSFLLHIFFIGLNLTLLILNTIKYYGKTSARGGSFSCGWNNSCTIENSCGFYHYYGLDTLLSTIYSISLIIFIIFYFIFVIKNIKSFKSFGKVYMLNVICFIFLIFLLIYNIIITS